MENCPECGDQMSRFCGGVYKCYPCDQSYILENGELTLRINYYTQLSDFTDA